MNKERFGQELFGKTLLFQYFHCKHFALFYRGYKQLILAIFSHLTIIAWYICIYTNNSFLMWECDENSQLYPQL